MSVCHTAPDLDAGYTRGYQAGIDFIMDEINLRITIAYDDGDNGFSDARRWERLQEILQESIDNLKL